MHRPGGRERERREIRDVDKFAEALMRLAEAGRRGAEAGRAFARAMEPHKTVPLHRLPILAYRLTSTDGAMCEASRLGFSPANSSWPAAHN